jgi:hypothetical protein
MSPPNVRKPVSAVADNRPPKVVRLGGETAIGSSNDVPLRAQLKNAGTRVEVWCCLFELLDRLRARVGDALNDYENQLVYDDALIAELKADVDSFTRLAAILHRRSRP